MNLILETIRQGATVFSEPILFVYMLGGMLFGMYAGALPGISVSMAITLAVTFTSTWDAGPAIAVMIGIYVAGVYGGSRAAVLLNIPGTPASIATTFDGYPLAQKGKAARALSVTAVQSVIGGVISSFVLLLAAPLITKLALMFSSWDYFLLSLMGILLLGRMSQGSFQKAVMGGCLGMLIGCIGMDGATAVNRFTFGNIFLKNGISSMTVMLGVFGISEALMQLRESENATMIKQEIGSIFPSFQDAFGHLRCTLESSVIGVVVGALPGTGGSIAALIAYDRAKKTAKNPETPFGEGAIEGLIASEASNNAAVGGALIPMLTLGIPGDGVTAILLSALLLHGVSTGPNLMNNGSGMFGIIVIWCLIANILLFPVALTGIRLFSKIVEVPKEILLPIVIMLSVVGSYATSKNIGDVYFMCFLGIVGYFLKLHGFNVGTLALGVILSSLIELNFRRSWVLSKGQAAAFMGEIVGNPLSLILFAAILLMVFQPVKWLRGRSKKA